MLKGDARRVDQARRVLDISTACCRRAPISPIRCRRRDPHGETDDNQLTLPTLESKGKWPRPRSPRASARSMPARRRRTPICAPWSAPSWCSASARPAPARPISRSPMPATLLERGEVNRIILSRPAVEAGERLGFLPGDMKEKVDPYLRPLYDALYDMMPPEHVERCITPASSKSRRSPSCAAARWPMPPSSSTRRRTPRRCR